MNVLILGGQSPRHQQWVRQVAETLEPHFDKVVFLDYRHWQTGAEDIDINYELNQVAERASRLDDYMIVAKSIGTVVTTLGVATKVLAPKKCVFLGFPLAVVESNLPELAAKLPNLPSTVFVQNRDDPLGSFEAVKKYVEANEPKNCEFKELSGSTHDYIDFDLITKFAAS
jgi:predicted alpha/beta-hydrolase family hydrolase